jgi:hypothetical protein
MASRSEIFDGSDKNGSPALLSLHPRLLKIEEGQSSTIEFVA